MGDGVMEHAFSEDTKVTPNLVITLNPKNQKLVMQTKKPHSMKVESSYIICAITISTN